MSNAKNIILFITITVWATLIGAVTYSHVAFFPAFLHHLPDSTNLLRGPYGIHDEKFWMTIHPVLIVCLLVSLIINRKLKERRTLILVPFCIYVVVLIITFLYFVPELQAFAKSDQSGIPAEEWLQRGTKWEQLSWVRGTFLYAGFVFLLNALVKQH